jgi:general secretion pathway protein E
MMKLAELNLGASVAVHLRDAVNRDRGLLLFCGSAGGGKTTTKDALLDSVKGGRPATSLTAIRSSPGSKLSAVTVVDVGDIRDSDAAQTAVEMAQTRLVLGVLRSGRSHGVRARLSAMGVPDEVMARVSIVVATQQLCRRLCEACKVPMAPSGEALELLGLRPSMLALSGGYVYAPGKCEACKEGYDGHVAIFEVLSDSIPGDAAAGAPGGLATDGLLKLVSGMTSLAELRRVLF